MRVQLETYSYNVSLSRAGDLFRYDSPDTDLGPTTAPHHYVHHRHSFDVFGTWEELKPVQEVKERNVPTLRQVVQEAERWYWENRDRLSKAARERS